MKILPVFVGLVLIVSLIACTVTDQAREPSASTAMTPVVVTNQPSDNIMVKVILQERKQWRCGDLVFDNRFSGARLNDLLLEPDGRFTVFTDPETTPINPSPWYAFTIYSPDARTITLDVKIRYTEKGKPLVSNIAPWVRSATRSGSHLPLETWTKGAERTSTILRLDPGVNLITAFDPVTLEEVLAWQTSMQSRPNVTSSVIGSSIEGRPIEQFTISEASTPDQHYLILIGGQHPPEITGNRGLRHFVNALCATTEPALSFRSRFRVVVIPMINPDGKYHGHWRTNLAGIDLNRDWVEFQQPETCAVRDYLITLGKKSGVTLHAMIDFHSVYRNMMYIQSKDATARLADFTATWLGNLEKNHGRQMVTEYDNGFPASKRWFMATFGNNGYTREFAYLDQEDVIQRQAEQEAEEMMKLLLQRVVATP